MSKPKTPVLKEKFMPSDAFPSVRMRRLRQTPALRALVRETSAVSMSDLILPLFVEEEIDKAVPIASMPGVSRIPEKDLAQEIKAIQKDGVKAVMLFGVSHKKDATGSDTWKADGLLARMIKRAKDAAPEIVVMVDTCFCEYTDHGHCGIWDGDKVSNDTTLTNLTRQAITSARAGADVLAPSSMMDGQIAALRDGLDASGFTHVPLMAYSSKFASAFYGPFRAAAGCDLKGDRLTYQMDPANGREALRESLLDQSEGADFLMVKPGLPYLDVLKDIRAHSLLPLAVYQVSGEYAMIKFASQAGAVDEKRIVRETLTSFKRAGADLILTYFARDVAREGF